MRLVWFAVIGVLAAVTACDRGNDAAQSDVDPRQLTSSGEVALSDGGSMSFNITSERYKQWDHARREFPKSLITRFGQVLQPRSPSERSIASAVALLERHPGARAAVERAGLSVRGFVEITVALEQQMMMASAGAPASAPPSEVTYPITMDSGYYFPPAPTYTPPPVTPLPQPYPAQPYSADPYTPIVPAPRDTMRRDSVAPVLPRSPPPPDTLRARWDTAPARRDTVIAPPPAPRDTAAPDTSGARVASRA